MSGFSRTVTGLAVTEALPIAKQISDAIEAAHKQGVTHRDLKPANIKVREDGIVKVLDFGLAKLAAPRRVGAERWPAIPHQYAGRRAGTHAHHGRAERDCGI